MSILRNLSIFTLFTTGLSGTLLTQNSYAQTSTQPRPAAKPKAKAVPKRTPIRKPSPVAQPGNFSVPDLGNDSWYSLEGVSSTQLSDEGAKANQIGLVGVVNYFGTGAGIEYIRSFAPFGLAITGLFTTSNLKDEQTSTGQDQDEAVEYFDTKSTYLRVHGRFNFFRYAYLSSGLTFDQINGKYGWRGTSISDGQIQTNFTSTLTMLDLMVGSEFRGPWGTYFGIDWIGTSYPISSTIKYEENSDLNITSQALKGAQPDQRIDDETTAQLRVYYLNIRVGWTF